MKADDAGRSRGRHDLGLLDGLVQLSFAVHAALGRVAERHELSLIQVRLLGILRDREPGMQELATYLNLDKSSITGLVTRAEGRGLVRRFTTPEDRRAVNVTLTPKGRELAQVFAKQLELELAVLVQDLSEADRRRLSTLASRVVLDDLHRRYPDGVLPPRTPS
ncbi:MarR family transcriptional regulator [Pendulispora rubella]|uniref:MarR family transcriptional regulator n=1 Tax=Pendulispora rubella TaxID=2741070 RepID=A0ABZ2L2W3_9BACT